MASEHIHNIHYGITLLPGDSPGHCLSQGQSNPFSLVFLQKSCDVVIFFSVFDAGLGLCGFGWPRPSAYRHARSRVRACLPGVQGTQGYQWRDPAPLFRLVWSWYMVQEQFGVTRFNRVRTCVQIGWLSLSIWVERWRQKTCAPPMVPVQSVFFFHVSRKRQRVNVYHKIIDAKIVAGFWFCMLLWTGFFNAWCCERVTLGYRALSCAHAHVWLFLCFT